VQPEQPYYKRQVDAQIAQYAAVEDVHQNAPAALWMGDRFLAPILRQVFGSDTIAGCYATQLSEAVNRCGVADVVSLGSGDCSLEIKVAQALRQRDERPFRITCLELSPILVERARRAIGKAEIDDVVQVLPSDLNRDLPLSHPVGAFMAHHSLHHIVALETLFGQIVERLEPEGAFITMDLIGRNGHMRWPETLAIVRHIWSQLPDRLKWDHMFGRHDRWYENWDCSIEGFEGIRAQDILPLLIECGFGFERFFATGGLTDVFYDRRFGPNFDLGNALDVQFLERLHWLQEDLLERGKIKPVEMFAVIRSPHSRSTPSAPICGNDLNPALAVRPIRTTASATAEALATTQFASPYPACPAPDLTAVPCGQTVWFGRGGEGETLLRWGWATPENDFTWSLGIESALQFVTAGSVSQIDFQLMGYQPPATSAGSLQIAVNGQVLASVNLDAPAGDRLCVRVALPAGACTLVEFTCSRPRRPDIDGGTDQRPLGIALIAMTLQPR
jgi:SAM-dependent methyltransferase